MSISSIRPLWELLDLPSDTPARTVAGVLQDRHERGLPGQGGVELEPYAMTFLFGEHSALAQSVYDELVTAASTGVKTGLRLEHPIVGVVARLAGVAASRTEESPMAPPPPPTVEEPFRKKSPVRTPPGFEQVPVSVTDRLRILTGWVLLPALLAASVGIVLYFSPNLFARLSSTYRDPDVVANRVGRVLERASGELIAATDALQQLDRLAASAVHHRDPPWHDPSRDPVPSAVRAWLVLPVRTEAARREQDRLILRYLSLASSRRELANELRSLRGEISSSSPGRYSGASLEDEFETSELSARASRATTTAQALLVEWKAISEEAPRLKDK